MSVSFHCWVKELFFVVHWFTFLGRSKEGNVLFHSVYIIIIISCQIQTLVETHMRLATHPAPMLFGKFWVGSAFAFRTASNHMKDSTRCWKHSSEILVHINMLLIFCRFVSCTCVMWISSNDGGHWSTVSWLLCSRNLFKMILAFWKQPSEDGHKEVIMGWRSLWTKGSKVTPTTTWTTDARKHGPCLYSDYTKFWPYNPNSRHRLRLIRPGSLLSSNFGEPEWTSGTTGLLHL